MPWWAPWVGTGVVFVVVATALWWWVPKWQANRLRLKIRDPKARADVEDNFRKTIGQLIGGAAVLVGTGFAYYQSQLAQQATHDQLTRSALNFPFVARASLSRAMRSGKCAASSRRS
ncbi:MAG TPA: hypothetical protein VNY06_05220 [Methylocella sp.]|nr:hypothetical protein [Methylocella sp.]